MIYEPVIIESEDDQLWHSVDITLPSEIDRELRNYAEADGDSWTVQIHAALYQYRFSFMTREEQKAELEKTLVTSLDSGPTIEATPAFWKDFKHRVLERHQKLQDLRASGQLGNLSLPVELYEFVKEKVTSQEYVSPTEIVLVAMPFLRTWRQSK